MPQLDVNMFLPILYWLCLSFNICFALLYVLFFLPFINKTKIINLYKIKMLICTYILYTYLKQISNLR